MDELVAAGAWSVNQSDLEKNVAQKANLSLREREIELDTKRLHKTKESIKKAQRQYTLLQRKSDDPRLLVSRRESARAQAEQFKERELDPLLKDLEEIEQRLQENTLAVDSQDTAGNSSVLGKRLNGETEREFLIRTGKITPFAPQDLAFEDEPEHSMQFLRKPSESISAPNPDLSDSSTEDEKPHLIARKTSTDQQPNKKRRHDRDETEDENEVEDENMSSDYKPDSGSESEYEEEDEEEKFNIETANEHEDDLPEIQDPVEADDGNPAAWRRRCEKWELRTKKPQYTLDKNNGFFVPGEVWESLFGYQKTGVRWLYELYMQKTGGIIGDEMGLGKTVQVAAFVAALMVSNRLKTPCLIVCPATVLHQWVAELHQWWPPLRVAILHSIGSGMKLSSGRAQDSDDDDFDEGQSLSQQDAKKLVDSIFKTGHVILTTYAGIKSYRKCLLTRKWGFCCLDEGHKIRNPNSDVALAVKQIKTPHRLILSGTPIQNNLTELWSLFDFVFPGRLGTLPGFQQQFSVPINVGGYANASNVQVQTAYKCAVILRNTIGPYLLRRMKADVASDLPDKKEKVLFCSMTDEQLKAYRIFLDSKEMKSIFARKRQVLYGIDILRKICNHPDLLLLDTKSPSALIRRHSETLGDWAKSGKMKVVKALIEQWQTGTEKHRTLLFAQTRQMLDILETFTKTVLGVDYLRMDGTTPIGHRQSLVDRFNNTDIPLFLLTTKVGGLGINLTGADRVIIYDPDWNPSTDLQARERAWRLGQKKQVMIYRLLTAGTIEEKIYHRQIFKQFLTNKILKDPKQRRFFKMTDLHDLFSLGSESETDGLFGEFSKRGQVDDDFAKIKGVAKSDDYMPASENPDRKEDGIMNGVFSSAGVQSELEHEAILQSDKPDTVLLEREASRIANAAAEALKKSRREAKRQKIGVPTWTGQKGKAGAPIPLKAGASSKSLINKLRAARDLERQTYLSTPKSDPADQEVRKATNQLKKACAFLENQPDNKAPSAAIVEASGANLLSDQDVANFRRMIRQIADWKADERVWVLRQEQ